MKTTRITLMLAMLLAWSTPLAAQELETAPANDPAMADIQPAGTTQTLDLILRMEAALGVNVCINGADHKCAGYPLFQESQDAGAYGRIGATVFLPDPVAFLSAGLIIDFGGYTLNGSPDKNATSRTFHLAAMLRGFIPIEQKDWELTAAIGMGLGYWGPNDSWPSWVGLTIPLTVGIGYEVYEHLVVGGEVNYLPRLADNAPLDSIQFGVYVAYRLPMSFNYATE